MKKLLMLLTVLIILVAALAGCNGNTDTGNGHTHQYTEKLTYVEGARIIAPTCTIKGKYYYVCTCGAIGTETYETDCIPHSFEDQVSDSAHFASEATCQKPAQYYYDCATCDKISDEQTFSIGSRVEHSYQDNVCIYGCGDELNKYTLSAGGDYYTLTLFREKTKVVNVPAQYKGLPVKAIGSHAFAGNAVEEIVLPESVTVIEGAAFYMDTTVKKINLENVTEIGEQAFDGCKLLTEIELNENAVLGDYCFVRTGLTEITIPEGITNIGTGAFSSCSALTKIYYNAASADDIEYPNSVFSNYDSEAKAVTLYVGKNVERLPSSFFSNSKVSDIIIHEECNSLTIGNYAFYQAALPTELTLDRVATVGLKAFYDSGITKLTLDGHIDLVEDEAFAGCEALTEVTIMKNRGRFGQFIFANCDNLETVYYRHEGEEVLYRALWSITNESFRLVIGNNVKTIPAGFEAGGIKYLEFEAGASDISIGENAFISDIQGELDLSCVKSIGNNAFGYTLSGIDKLILPEGLTSLGANAFRNVDELIYLAENCADIPLDGNGNRRAAFTEIGSVSFGGKVLYLPANIFHSTQIGTVSFENENQLIEKIGDYAFCNATVSSISLPSNVIEIGDYAFYRASVSDSSLNLNHIKDFGDYSFANYNGSLDINAPHFVYIGESVFYQCAGIVGELDLSSVAQVGEDCFNGCTEITKVIIGEGIVYIGYRAFEDCTGLTEVVFNAIDFIEITEGNPTFFAGDSHADGFKLTVGKSAPRIPSYLFNYSAVNEIVFEGESSCQSIGEYAFGYTYHLELVDIVLPDSVKTIENSAFVLTKAHSITFGSGIEYIGENAFWSMGVIGEEDRGYGFLEEIYFTSNVNITVYSYNNETGVITSTNESVAFTKNDSGSVSDKEKANDYAKLLYRGNLIYSIEPINANQE